MLPGEFHVIKDFDRERAIDFVLARLDPSNLPQLARGESFSRDDKARRPTRHRPH
jgi:hypothetical protein